jgi:hypothetical protein
MASPHYSTGTMAHANDADFRAWYIALRAMLLDVGWVAAETNLDTATMTRPGASTVAGYEVFYLNDSLHGTAPIYLKLEPGTGTATTTPAVWMTVGIGTDGAGTVASPIKTTRVVCAPTGTATTGTNDRYAVGPLGADGVDGLAWVNFNNPASGSQGFVTFGVFRTCDSNGEPTAEGCVVYHRGTSGGTNPTVQALRCASPAQVFAADTGANFHCIPHGVSSTKVGLAIQPLPHWMPCPTFRPVRGICTYVATLATPEMAYGTPVDFTLFGVSAMKWMPLGPAIGNFGGSSTYGYALAWGPPDA